MATIASNITKNLVPSFSKSNTFFFYFKFVFFHFYITKLIIPYKIKKDTNFCIYLETGNVAMDLAILTSSSFDKSSDTT